MSEFDNSLAEGKVYEHLIEEFLTSKNYEIEDVSDNEYYRSVDTDFLFSDIHGNKVGLELKADNVIERTKNVFIEDKMFRKTGTTLGWGHHCECTILCIYNTISHVAYMLNWKKIQPILNNFPNRTFWNWRDKIYGSGWLIPLKYILENGLCYTQFDLSEYIKNKENKESKVA